MVRRVYGREIPASWRCGWSRRACSIFDFCPLINWSPVSQTCTTPFDRLRIFLILLPPDPAFATVSRSFSMKAIANAVTRIYVENGILGFWTGNGLSVARVLPESAIKFLSYESSVRCPPPRGLPFYVNCDYRSECSLRTGTTSRTAVRSAGSAG